MHVFLTGDRQVGKSWAVSRAAEATGKPCVGFLTRFLTPEHGASALYMVPPDRPDLLDREHMVAEPLNGKMHALTEQFDTLGVRLLREAQKHPEALILMDECGHLEKNAGAFQREIARCLNGDIPVLGVLRRDQPWHDFIRNHPRVRVLTVTVENRDELVNEIMALLREE